ncbi:MAG: DUF6152 family protein [Rubrivivax sp.]|nr:DUF6152 family protein [Rubrivivax sp.]
MNRRLMLTATALLALRPAWAHHGWSSFDQTRPLYLEGRAVKVAWRNPHVELELELPPDPKLPPDLATRSLPAQAAPVDGAALLKAASLPTRKDRRWEIELAPLSRMQAWQVPEIRVGDTVGVLGFTFSGEKGDAVLRGEYVFVGGRAYGLRSSPA